ncbi:MAG: hypothetical protein DMG96_43280, partial [Acidobacteria bacterium]
YLHIDLDALNTEIAPGIVDDPVPGGLSLHQMEDLIRAMCCRLRLRAAALTTYNPGRDHDGKTLRVSLRVLECWQNLPERASSRTESPCFETGRPPRSRIVWSAPFSR